MLLDVSLTNKEVSPFGFTISDNYPDLTWRLNSVVVRHAGEHVERLKG